MFLVWYPHVSDERFPLDFLPFRSGRPPCPSTRFVLSASLRMPKNASPLPGFSSLFKDRCSDSRCRSSLQGWRLCRPSFCSSRSFLNFFLVAEMAVRFGPRWRPLSEPPSSRTAFMSVLALRVNHVFEKSFHFVSKPGCHFPSPSGLTRRRGRRNLRVSRSAGKRKIRRRCNF